MNGPKQGAPDQAREHEALLARVRVRIVGFATYLGCGNDAEDLAQETMVVLFNKYAEVADAEEMSKLAPKICANLALNWRRNKSNPAKAVELPVGLADASGQDPESAATEKELKGLLLKAIQGSDARCKELLRLRLAGANTKEIAADMGMTAGAVDTAYFRCLQRLRGALGGRK
jgi:RNA polymerase sigma factor (sigma-70 family)